MNMAELALSYREQEALLRSRIRLVETLPEDCDEDRISKRDRLRLLEAMRRDVRDVAVVCEHYYDRSYCRSERFLI